MCKHVTIRKSITKMKANKVKHQEWIIRFDGSIKHKTIISKKIKKSHNGELA